MATIMTARFNVNPTKTLDDLAGCARTWISGSPHYGVPQAGIAGLGTDGFRYQKGNILIASEGVDADTDPKLELLGISVTSKYGRETWQTGIVGKKASNNFEVSIENQHQTSQSGKFADECKKPRIINDILSCLGGGFDGAALRVRTEPYLVKDDELPFVAEILGNKTGNNLPVIYLTRDINEGISPNISDLSGRVSGLAHVLVEPSRDFSFKLGRYLGKRHTFNGFIGLYWPTGWVERIPGNDGDLIQTIYMNLVNASRLVVLPEDLTFSGIKSMKTMKEITALREKIRQGHVNAEEKAIELALDEIAHRDNTIASLRETISDLSERMSERNGSQAQGRIGGLVIPQTPEMYGGEVVDRLVDALRKYRDSSTGADTRDREIIESVVGASSSSGRREEIIGAVKRMFYSNPRHFTEGMANELRAMGFEVEHGGKHPIISVRGSGIQVTIPSTPSDSRSGKNTAELIKRKLL